MKFDKGIVKALAVIIMVVLLTQVTGCGTILYPERRGQKVHGDVDTKIAILDGIGLLFFIIPGLIAFGVDFYTGAIYLRPGEKQVWGENQTNKEILTLNVDPKQLDQKTIERLVSEHIGCRINLDDRDVLIWQYQGTNIGEFKHRIAQLDAHSRISD